MDDDRYYSNTYDVSHPHEDLGSILIALIFKRYNLCAMVELKRWTKRAKKLATLASSTIAFSFNKRSSLLEVI